MILDNLRVLPTVNMESEDGATYVSVSAGRGTFWLSVSTEERQLGGVRLSYAGARELAASIESVLKSSEESA